MLKKLVNNQKICYVIIFVCFFVICFFIPYTHDDWAWGSEIGINRLKKNFENYNGRWCGNLLELAITRNSILKTLVMALSFTGIIILLKNITGSKNKSVIYLSLLLFLLIPVSIFKESIGWVAGFANYVPPILICLLIIYLNRDLFDKVDVSKDGFLKTMLMFFLGFTGSLFIEHVTTYLLVLSMFSVIYFYLKNKKIKFSLVFLLIGVTLGSVLMFSNGGYSQAFSDKETYMNVNNNIIENAITAYFNAIYDYFVFGNNFFNIILSVLIIKIIYNYSKEHDLNIFMYVIVFMLGFIPCYSLVTSISGVLIVWNYTKYLNGILAVIYYLCVLISVIIFIKDKVVKEKIIFALLSIAVLVAPLFIVSPIGGRNFFPIYVFWIWIVLEMYDSVMKAENEVFSTLLLSSICVLVIYYICIFGYVFKVNMQREKYIREHSNDEVLILPKLPYSGFMWNPDPVSEGYAKRFKLFYNIDVDKKIEFLEYMEWKELLNE